MSPIDFTLFAPTISQVNLIGSFSQWQKEIPMTADHGTFRCSLDLTDGDYHYKFRCRRQDDSSIDIVDPYVKKFDPQRNTGLITVKNGRIFLDDYVWQHDGVALPQNSELIIYEMYIADFADHGTFLGVIEKLDYLKDLGVNAIELMPIQESMGCGHDWGYLTRHFFALKTTYGSSSDLKQLIDQCHQRGIRVIIDAVFNHTASDCPLEMLDHHYWYFQDRHHPEDSCHWGPELNYEYYDEEQKCQPAAKFAGDVVRYWIGEFHLDGIRFDAAKQMDNYDILRELDSIGRSVRSSQPFYTAAEYVPEEPSILKSNGGPVDACWSCSFHGVVGNNLMDTSKLELDLLKYVIGAGDLINYLSCHDNERLLFLFGKNANLFDGEAFRRMRLAMIILFSAVSVPFVSQGDELGESREWGSEDQHRRAFPMQWHLLSNERNRTHFNLCKRLIELRKQHKEMSEKHANFFFEHHDDRVLVYRRSERLVIVTHFSSEEKSDYEISSFPQNGKWIDWLSDEEYQVENNRFKGCLRAFEGKVLVWHQQ